MAVRVKITFNDGRTPKEFYATEGYSNTAEGRMLYWEEDDTSRIISYPVSVVAEIIESEVD